MRKFEGKGVTVVKETRTLPVLRALDRLTSRVREFHPEVPEVVIVVGAPGRGKVHGHMAPDSWRVRGPESGAPPLPEVSLAGESLSRGGRDTAGTLIHELVHAYCHVTGIKDTSNVGRYHNQRFRDVAEAFGLRIDKAPVIGWSVTEVPDDTAERYAAEIAELEEAITTWRDQTPVGEAPAKPKPSKFAMECPECCDPVAVKKSWWEANGGQLSCIVHGVGYVETRIGGDNA